ncbi:MAG TPA: hypothetical protein VLZ78_03970 [Terrimesophilobacter sp.]|nr:hypothetical protein [Terrimesophilobacter sp.]
MRRLFYVSGSVVIGDRMCKALLRYARALSKQELSDVVTVPIVGESGVTEYAHFLIGPASQLFSIPVEGKPDAVDDKKVLMDLERRTKALQPDRPMWSHEMTDVPELDDYLDLPGADQG